MRRSFKGVSVATESDRPTHWSSEAACLPHPVLFDEAANHCDDPFKTRERLQEHRTATLAKNVCRGCDVKAECLAWALETEELVGVLGGTTPKERREMLKNRRRPK